MKHVLTCLQPLGQLPPYPPTPKPPQKRKRGIYLAGRGYSRVKPRDPPPNPPTVVPIAAPTVKREKRGSCEAFQMTRGIPGSAALEKFTNAFTPRTMSCDDSPGSVSHRNPTLALAISQSRCLGWCLGRLGADMVWDG